MSRKISLEDLMREKHFSIVEWHDFITAELDEKALDRLRFINYAGRSNADLSHLSK